MMKKTSKLFALCYGGAAALWLAVGLFATARAALKTANGSMPHVTLSAEEVERKSFIDYAEKPWLVPPTGESDWYLSTDNDPQLLWSGEAFVETVTLHAYHDLPAGSVVLYYRKPGQTDYSETQKIYATLEGSGVYSFNLGGRTVSGLRIDPDSEGGVPTRFTGVELNAPRAPYKRFVPTGGEWFALLALPAMAAAVCKMISEILHPET